MEARYAAYYELFDAYTSSLELEKELYGMLQQEDTEQEELNEQINNINESYQSVLDYNEQFNENTVSYNDLKQEFYDVAEINVTYEETESKEETDEGEET